MSNTGLHIAECDLEQNVFFGRFFELHELSYYYCLIL